MIGRRPGGPGGHLLSREGETIDGTTTTKYAKFTPGKAENFSIDILWISPTTFSAAVTFWASNLDEPDETSDADWIQMEAVHGFAGLPNGDPASAGATGGDTIEVGNAGHLHYRVKVARSAGSATLKIIASAKDLK